MKTAVIQLKATSNKKENIKKAEDFVHQAIKKGAKFILLPEVFSFRGENITEAIEKVPGPSLRPLINLARRYKVYVLAGSVYEKVFSCKDKAYNTSVLINPKGDIQKKYRKKHLFRAKIGHREICEHKKFLAGHRMAMTRVGQFHLGMSICYDLRFPVMYEKYRRQGADILCVPSSFTRQTGQKHWEVLLRARAIENICYVLAPNQVGQDDQGVDSYGHSLIIDPWGEILAEASGTEEQIIWARLQKRHLRQKRAILGRSVYAN